MAKARGDFTEILVRQGVLGADQLEEAKNVAQQSGQKIQDVLIKMEYANQQQIMGAIAEFHGMQFIDLADLTVPAAVVELVPESVARENVVLPLSFDNGVLQIVMSDPSDFDTVEKLQFILNKDIQPVLANREQIIEAINRHYGQTETESVDSMLAEFTDTPIDFTETERPPPPLAADDGNDAPVIKLVNLIIQEAIQPRVPATSTSSRSSTASASATASTASWSSATARRAGCSPRMLSRIKIMGNIDIAEKRRPQDGRIKMTVQRQALRPARQHPADHPRPVGGHAHPRPRQHSGEHQGPGLRRGRLQAASSRSSNAPTASSWSRGRPARARPPPSTPP